MVKEKLFDKIKIKVDEDKNNDLNIQEEKFGNLNDEQEIIIPDESNQKINFLLTIN